MCCDVDTCCCCIDLRSGVKALGGIGVIVCIIGLISGIVMMENQRKMINDCPLNVPNDGVVATPDDFNGLMQVCADQKDFCTCSPFDVQARKDWFDKYYYVAVMLPHVSFNLLAIAVNALLVLSVVKCSRCMMLPWLIANMIWIVLIGIGLLVMVIGLGFIQFAKTETKASIAYGLGLVGLILMFAIEIYAWVVVVSLFRKMAMIANFNNGMVLPIQQPIPTRPISRSISSPISTSDNGFLNEGYNSENPANYNI